ncbi:sensor histidine kinase [Larkinella terrae]|uniref:histidine kinase n=1 Tax=Larkinella terrae TaxID=2025311 RepID=A0A7K0ERE7_9BACT|nr:ATP-binding protein [Larkinella terrae]MRS64400.1 sensor histidine kinase [Larkinella terrae]
MVNKPHEVVLSITTIILLILLLVGVVFAFFFVFRQRWKQRLLQESSVRETLQSQLDIQKRTVQQIGQELQDYIGPPLALTVNQLNVLEKKLAATPQGPAIKQTLEKLTQTQDAVQHLFDRIGSGTARQYKIKEIIALELEQIQRVGQFQTRFHSVGTPYILDEKTEKILFSIIQESLTNAVKHSGGSQLTVTTNYGPDQFILIIADDGCGFDVEKTANQVGSGLKNVQERTRLLGGESILNSEPGWGTRIEIRLPRAIA